MQFPLSRLKRLFEEQGIAVESAAAIVTVYRVGDLDLQALKTVLREQFLAHYPQMHIAEITVRPQSFIDVAGLELIEVVVAENSLRRNQGTFQAWYGQNGQGLKRLFFAYEVAASLQAFAATRQINGGGIVGADNVRETIIAFETLSDRPLAADKLGRVAAKGRIAAGDVIFQNRVALVPDVRKNGRIRVELIESGIRLTFLATAQRDAQIGESVEVKDDAGRSFTVRVISKELARVE
ncbi:MAG: flagellar basal body P-ring formation chaperone FlgA [Campylobacterales bacterium]